MQNLFLHLSFLNVNEKIQTNSHDDLHLFHSKQIGQLKSLFKAQFNAWAKILEVQKVQKTILHLLHLKS